MRDLKGSNKVEHILKIFLIFKNYWKKINVKV